MNKKYIYVGNRHYVLEKMIEQKLDIRLILVRKDSYLEKYLLERKISFTSFSKKNELLNLIENADFDILVSNGGTFILPISKLKKEHQLFINLHPSLLPDLKGRNPVNGAFLFNKNAGVTCHHMDDNIDTGKIIAQIDIGNIDELDVNIVYKLSFMGEGEAFLLALKRSFMPNDKIKNSSEGIYYSFVYDDLNIDLKSSNEEIIKKVRAFAVKSKRAILNIKNAEMRIMEAEILQNTFLISKLNSYSNFEIIFVCEKSIVIKKDNEFLKLGNIIGDFSFLKEGDFLI